MRSALIVLFAAVCSQGASFQTEPFTLTTEYGDVLTIGSAPLELGSSFDVTVSAMGTMEGGTRLSAVLAQQQVTADGMNVGYIPWWLVFRVRPEYGAQWRLDLIPQVDLMVGRVAGEWVIVTGDPLTGYGPLGGSAAVSGTFRFDLAPVPEPVTIGLCGLALLAVGLARGKRRARHDGRR